MIEDVLEWLRAVHERAERTAPDWHRRMNCSGRLSPDEWHDECWCGAHVTLTRVEAEQAMMAGLDENPWLVVHLAWGWRTQPGYLAEWAPKTPLAP